MLQDKKIISTSILPLAKLWHTCLHAGLMKYFKVMPFPSGIKSAIILKF